MSWDQTEMDRMLRNRYMKLPIDFVNMKLYLSFLSDSLWSLFEHWVKEPLKNRHVVFDHDSKNKQDWLLFFLTANKDVFFIFDLFNEKPHKLEDEILRIIHCEFLEENKECDNPLIQKSDFYFWNPKPSIDRFSCVSWSPEIEYFSPTSPEISQEQPSKSRKSLSKTSKSPENAKSSQKPKSPKSLSNKRKSLKRYSPKSLSKKTTSLTSGKSPNNAKSSQKPTSPQSKKTTSRKNAKSQTGKSIIDSQKTIPIIENELCEEKSQLICQSILHPSKVASDFLQFGGTGAHVLLHPKGKVIKQYNTFTYDIEEPDGKIYQIQFYQRTKNTNEQTRINRFLAIHDFYPNFQAFGFDDLRWVGTKIQILGMRLMDYLQTSSFDTNIITQLEELLKKLTKAHLYMTELNFTNIQIHDGKLYLLHSYILRRTLSLEQQYHRFVTNIRTLEKDLPNFISIENWIRNLTIDKTPVMDKPNISDRKQLMLETDISSREFIRLHFGEDALDLIDEPVLSIKKACQPNQPFVFKLDNTILKITKSTDMKYIDVARYEILMHQALLDASNKSNNLKMAPNLVKVKEWIFNNHICVGSVQERLQTVMSLLYSPEQKTNYIQLFESLFDYLVDLCSLSFWHHDLHMGNLGFIKTPNRKDIKIVAFDYEYASLGHSTTDCQWVQELMMIAWSIEQEKTRLLPDTLKKLVLGLRHLHQLMYNKTKKQKTNQIMAMPSTYYDNYEKDMAFYSMDIHQKAIFKNRPDFAMRRTYVKKHLSEWQHLLSTKI